MAQKISASSIAVLLFVWWLVPCHRLAHALASPQAELEKEPIQILSHGFGGNGDPEHNPRVIVAVVPEALFSRDELPRVARHLLSQYDDSWLELWVYSDRAQLVDSVDVNLFRYFDDEELGAQSRRPWAVALRLDGRTELKFKDRATNRVVVMQWEPNEIALPQGAT